MDKLIEPNKLKQASDVLRALAHPIRLDIVQFIDTQKITNVNKIYSNLKLEQSITSQHLKILRQANLVKTQRDGKYIYYSLNYQKINSDVNSIKAFLKRD